MRTRQERARPTTASVKARQWKSGSGPTRKSMSRPISSVPCRTTVRGQVSSVVIPLTMRATGRRARWSRKCSPLKVTTGSVCALPEQRGDGRGRRPGRRRPSPRARRPAPGPAGRAPGGPRRARSARALGAHGAVSSASAAISKSRPICTGNPSTLPWSPAPAPAT